MQTKYESAMEGLKSEHKSEIFSKTQAHEKELDNTKSDHKMQV
jgi:hypothetical protein